MDFIKNLEPILICDIGASACDPTNHIEDLLNNTKSLLYGFEPNKDEHLKLTSRIDSTKKKYFDKAIGDGTEKEFNICNYPGWSSFLIPEKEYVKNFANFENDSIILKKEKIKTERLDNINFESSFKLSILALTNTVSSNMFGIMDLNFYDLNTISKSTLMVFMIVGKIELIAILFLMKNFFLRE